MRRDPFDVFLGLYIAFVILFLAFVGGCLYGVHWYDRELRSSVERRVRSELILERCDGR